MSVQALRITTYAPTQVGAVSRIKLVSQQVTGPAGADGEGAPNSATYVTLSANATLTGERVLTAGTGITLTDGGAGSTVTVATSAVLPTLADAKGDLLVASAADTITRLPVGTNNYVLTADSAQATGVKWAAASGGGVSYGRPAKSGTIYATLPGWIVTSIVSTSAVIDTVYYQPILLEADKTLTDLITYVTTGAAAGKVARLGVFSADTSWQPSALLLDAGTIAIDSSGAKTVSGLSLSMPAGRYLIGLWPNATCTLRWWGGHHVPSMALGPGYTANHQIMWWSKSATYGAWPGTPAAWDTVTDNPTSYAHTATKFA